MDEWIDGRRDGETGGKSVNNNPIQTVDGWMDLGMDGFDKLIDECGPNDSRPYQKGCPNISDE